MRELKGREGDRICLARCSGIQGWRRLELPESQKTRSQGAQGQQWVVRRQEGRGHVGVPIPHLPVRELGHGTLSPSSCPCGALAQGKRAAVTEQRLEVSLHSVLPTP